jgi:hypothetical protein
LLPPRLFAFLLFVLVGLSGRAVIDKLLALQGGAQLVAGWAQLASLSEIVSGVSLSGIGIGLTALAAGAKEPQRSQWLKTALITAFPLSITVAFFGLPLMREMGGTLLPRTDGLARLALLAGCLSVAPGLLVAWTLGAGWPGRAAALTAIGLLLQIGFLVLSPASQPLLKLLIAQILFGAGTLLGLVILQRRSLPVSRRSVAALLRFAPAGFAIGILSPASLAWARVEIADGLSWQAAGQVQAVWRTTEWITALAAAWLNAWYLPRMSALTERSAFLAELRRTAIHTILPATVALLLLWLALPWVMALLYRTDISVMRTEALFFLLGDMLRIAAWVALFGLFSHKAAWAITVGEFLSLPLFALLLIMTTPATLAGVGQLWLLTYLIYALFNAWALRRRLGKE